MRKVTLGIMCWLRPRLAAFSELAGYAAFFPCAFSFAHLAR